MYLLRSATSVGAPAEPDFDVQQLDPVPISDTNINAEDFEDGVEFEDDSTTRREGYLSYMFVRLAIYHRLWGCACTCPSSQVTIMPDLGIAHSLP